MDYADGPNVITRVFPRGGRKFRVGREREAHRGRAQSDAFAGRGARAHSGLQSLEKAILPLHSLCPRASRRKEVLLTHRRFLNSRIVR